MKFSAEEKTELHVFYAVRHIYSAVRVVCLVCRWNPVWGVGGWVSFAVRSSAVLWLARRSCLAFCWFGSYHLPDGSSEMSSLLGWQESLMIFRAFLTHRWVVDVLKGGPDDVLGPLNYFLRGSSHIRWWCSQSGCSTQCNCRTVWGFLSSDQISPVTWGRRDAGGPSSLLTVCE